MMPAAKKLTYWQAAKKTGRSVRTIRRWKLNGMPMSFDEHGRRVVDERILLKWWRDRMKAWPIHQQRMRTEK